MKIVIIAQTTEMEQDIILAAKASGDEVRIYSVSNQRAGHGVVTPHDKTNMEGVVAWAIVDLCERVRAWQPDLTILRYPYWAGQAGLLDDMRAILGERTLVYQTEQGPTREWGMMYSCGWKHLAVNSKADEVAYRIRFPGAQIHYLPFGCREIAPEELVPTPRYAADLVSDGWAHARCKCYGGWKGRSVQTMILPLLDFDLALYGRVDRDGWAHSWVALPELQRFYRGEYPPTEYPKVYASAKVYVGASWNWAHGGYGIRFAKVLATGIPVVWHRTVWMEEDGFQHGEQALFSSSPHETRKHVVQLLENPTAAAELGRRGQAWVREHWDWMTNLRRVAGEL